MSKYEVINTEYVTVTVTEDGKHIEIDLALKSDYFRIEMKKQRRLEIMTTS